MKIKYGIMGFGRYAERRLMTGFRNAKYSQIIALSKRDLSAAQEKADRFNIPYAYADPAKLVENPEVQAVIIASPPYFHQQHTLLAAAASKHVMVEKPMAVNAAESREMIEFCRTRQVVLMSAFVMRFIEAIQKVRDIVQSGDLGSIELIHAHFSIEAGASPRSWIFDSKISGGGPVADLGAHLLDLLPFILGERIVHVTSLLQPGLTVRHIERKAAALLRFRNGILGNLQVSFNCPRESGLTFHGSKAKLRIINFNRPETTVEIQITKNGSLSTIPVKNGNYFAAMLDHFSRVLLFSEELTMPGEAGLENQLLIDRIYGRTV